MTNEELAAAERELKRWLVEQLRMVVERAHDASTRAAAQKLLEGVAGRDGWAVL